MAFFLPVRPILVKRLVKLSAKVNKLPIQNSAPLSLPSIEGKSAILFHKGHLGIHSLRKNIFSCAYVGQELVKQITFKMDTKNRSIEKIIRSLQITIHKTQTFFSLRIAHYRLYATHQA